MLTKEQKKEIVEKLRKKLKVNKLAVFCNFEALSFERQKLLKNQFKKENCEIFVIKKSLLEKALEKEGLDFPKIVGSIMIGIGNDEVLPAKIIEKFPKEKKEKIEFVGGVINENEKLVYLSKEEVKEIAKLPSKEELLAKLIGSLKAPVANLVFVLSGNLRKISYVLSQVSNQK
jgi:large subunit ribosomal protein L10